MITKNEQIQLKEIIGAHYSDDVLDILNNKAIRNKNGHPHSAEYVRIVFQGVRENEDVEAAIWQLAELKKAEKLETEEKKQRILSETK